jgi:uncharacterized protein (TIGR00730 family)
MTPEELRKNQQAIVDSPSYQLAEEDLNFIGHPDLRPLRMQLELLKPEMTFREHDIESTVVMFGGTQVIPKEEAEAQIAAAKDKLATNADDKKAQRELQRAEARLRKSRFYDECRELARLVSTTCSVEGKCDYFVMTGGGPGIMEAANRGAYDAGAKSIGLNITLPEEQFPNGYISPELCFQFHYFALRKMHFLLRAKALVCFPGGFGTLDELFCTLTLRQVHRMQALPIILYGREYWENVINFKFLADEAVIRDEHMDLIDFAETPEEAWKIVTDFYKDGSA